MKKFLFTLASLVMFGFAANASAPTFAFSQSEVTMGAGETLELELILTGIDQYMKACDWTFNMVDPAGNLMTDKVKLQYLQKYGSRTRYQFFGKTGINTTNENTVSTSDGSHATNATMTTTGIYKLILSNAGSGCCFYNDEEVPQAFCLFTIEVEEGWEAEYAEFKLVSASCAMADDPSGVAVDLQAAPMTLKINNKDYAPAPQPEPAPVPTFREADGKVYAECDGHTVVLMINGQEVANPYTLPEAIYGEDQVINFTAYTVANADESANSAEVNYTATVAAKPYENFTGDIVITDPDDNGVVNVSYTGNETGYTMVVYVDNQVVLPDADGNITVTEGDHTIVVQVSAENYNTKSESKEVNYTAPVVLDPAMAPSVTSDITGYETATVIIKNNQEGGTVHYVIYNMADNSIYDQGEFTGSSKAIEVEGDGTYRVEAYCTADGYSQSSNTNGEFTINPGQQPTGISEIINGKNVANVRYFNMAGQEMQEANGMTIMVVTFTDGTTSTMKVMK